MAVDGRASPPRPWGGAREALGASASVQAGLSLAAEVITLVRFLTGHDIPTLPFKGPTLALLAYGNLAARRYNDLDLLFQPEDIERANQLLFDLGYRPVHSVSKAQWPAFKRTVNHWRLVHAATGINIEPHWRLLPVRFAPRLDLDSFWLRRQPVTLGGTTVWTLGPEDLTLYLALHGFVHRWERTQWLEDLHRFIERHPALDWDAIVARAVAGGVERAVLVALALSRRIFGTRLPSLVDRRIRRDPRVTALAARVEPDVRAGRNLGQGPGRFATLMPLHALAHSRWRDRARLLLEWVLLPKPIDLEWIRLPRALFPVYLVVRPIRLMVKYTRLLLGTLLPSASQTGGPVAERR